ncbi:MAG: hypothetical protein JO070_09305, partial [Verrucomicrobia bacterium]|nr:hypothetical protein [Verrucomicrobiota bacterium]
MAFLPKVASINSDTYGSPDVAKSGYPQANPRRRVKPFADVTITDPHAGATETLTITLSGGGGTLSGTGLTGSGATFMLTGVATTITSELDALSFAPKAGQPSTSSTTDFTLSDLSSAYATPTVNATTTVVDDDPAVPPTITGTVAGQTTVSEALIKLFAGVTITDPNGANDTLTITLTGGAPGTTSTTDFTLSDLSSVYATPTIDATTTVIDEDPALAPT